MTDEAIKARDEQLMAAFAVILTQPSDFAVIRLDDEIWIERVHDGGFLVGSAHQSDETFDDVRSAIAYYLDRREELALAQDLRG